jgi:hypothetical protein
MGEENFFDLIESIFEGHDFGWRALLAYIPARALSVSKSTREWEEILAFTDPDQINWKRSPGTAWECLDRWLEETGIGNEDYLCIEELRPGGEVRFHVIVANWSAVENVSLLEWRNISGGWAYPQPCGEGIKGLIGNKVMREHCALEVSCNGHRKQYTSADFRPWRPKS